MTDEIADILKEANLDLNLDDTAQGSLTFTYYLNGNVTQQTRSNFDANIVRVLTDWEITGMSYQPEGGNYNSPYSVSLNGMTNDMIITFGRYIFDIKSMDGTTRVINSEATGELVIKAIKDIWTNNPFKMKIDVGGILYFRDS